MGRLFDAASLPTPATSRAGAATARQAEIRALATQIAQNATVDGERYFTIGAELLWAAIVKRIDNLALERGAVRVRFLASSPGKTLVEGWRSSDNRGVVVAMLRHPGGGTVAYYQVRFEARR